MIDGIQPASETGLLRFASVILLCAGLLALLSACATTDADAPPPGVDFHWNTPGQISNTVYAVFIENGFLSAKGNYTKLVFEKKESLLSDLAYGGWSRQGLWVRIKVAITPAGEGTFRASCNAFRVEDRGQALEEETPLSARQTEKYNKLLEQAADRLKGEKD